MHEAKRSGTWSTRDAKVEELDRSDYDFHGTITVPCSSSCTEEEWLERFCVEWEARGYTVKEDPKLTLKKVRVVHKGHHVF